MNKQPTFYAPPIQPQIDNLNQALKKEIDTRKKETEDRLYDRDGIRKAIAQLEQRIIALENKKRNN